VESGDKETVFGENSESEIQYSGDRKPNPCPRFEAPKVQNSHSQDIALGTNEKKRLSREGEWHLLKELNAEIALLARGGAGSPSGLVCGLGVEGTAMSNNPLGERGSTFHTRHWTAISKCHSLQGYRIMKHSYPGRCRWAVAISHLRRFDPAKIPTY